MALVEVRPLPIAKWHGKSGKESITRPKTIEALPDKTMRYQVDMTEEQIQEYSKILKQDISVQFVHGEESFWNTPPARVTLENNTQFFDKENPIEYIKLAILRKSKDVALSLKDWEEGKAPEATHYIVDEQEEIKVHISKRNRKKAVENQVAKLTTEEKANIVFLISGKNVRKNSLDLIDYHLDELIDSRLADVENYLNRSTTEINIEALINECVLKNVLMKDGIKYKYQGSLIGNSLGEVIAYLSDDENQSFKLDLMQKIEA